MSAAPQAIHVRARELMERYNWKYELAKYAAQLEQRVRELEGRG